MTKKVSIITPSYNSAKFIAKTIESVLSQTYTNWEMIIVDDCSSDNSIEIIESYCNVDSRIKLIKLKENMGAAVARNNAIENAAGAYIAFLDSDDVWINEKLDIQIKFMLTNNINFSFSDYEMISEEDKYIRDFSYNYDRLSYKNILYGNLIGCSTVMYNVEKLGKIYMPLIRKRQDWGLWLRILKKTEFAYRIPQKLVSYRERQVSISSNKLSLIKYHWTIYFKLEKINIFKASFYLIRNIIFHLKK